MKGITGNPVLDAYGRMAVTPVGAARPAQTVEAAGSASVASTPAAEVTISSHAKYMAAVDLRCRKVRSAQEQLAEGKFKVDSQDVHDACSTHWVSLRLPTTRERPAP